MKDTYKEPHLEEATNPAEKRVRISASDHYCKMLVEAGIKFKYVEKDQYVNDLGICLNNFIELEIPDIETFEKLLPIQGGALGVHIPYTTKVSRMNHYVRHFSNYFEFLRALAVRKELFGF